MLKTGDFICFILLIAAASQEQSQGISQVNSAMSQMEQITQQNAANAEQSAGASEELSAQAEQVKTMVSELLALVRGSTSLGKLQSGKNHSLSPVDSAYHQIAQNDHHVPVQDELPLAR